MKGRRFAAVLLLLVITGVSASAFEFDIHVEMTREALVEVMDRWQPVENALRDPAIRDCPLPILQYLEAGRIEQVVHRPI